jgi:hypothetical protein
VSSTEPEASRGLVALMQQGEVKAVNNGKYNERGPYPGEKHSV